MMADELAVHLYTAWRERVDVLGSPENPFSRPKWHHLTTNEQQVWLHVAEVAHLMLAEVAR